MYDASMSNNKYVFTKLLLSDWHIKKKRHNKFTHSALAYSNRDEPRSKPCHQDFTTMGKSYTLHNEQTNVKGGEMV